MVSLNKHSCKWIFSVTGLEKRDSSINKLGIYGSDRMEFETSSWSAVTMVKLIWHYGWDMWKLGNWLDEDFLKKFER